MSKINFRKVTIVFLLLYLLVACIWSLKRPPIAMGEWDDYTYPAVTLLEEARAGIYAEDIPIIKSYFPEWADSIETLGINQLSGRTTRDGASLTWYFPTFAIASIPQLVLLRFMQLPAIYAFPVTNFLFLIGAILFVYRYLKVDDKTKLALLVLLSLNPIMFYMRWVSGEVLIYSFMLIALTCWYNRWYKRAAIFISLAGTLNTTIMSIGIMMIIEYGIWLFNGKKKGMMWSEYIKKNIPDVLKYASCYFIGLIPMAYFYYHVGHINLTASHAGFLQGREQTWQRFFTYLLDLNLGMLPYYSIVLFLGIILFLMGIIRKNERCIIWLLAFVFNVMLYSVMVHINSGMSGIARYNAWGVLVLLFAVCLFSKDVFTRVKEQKIVNTGIWVSAATLPLLVFTGVMKTSHMKWAPLAGFVLDTCPSVYNPLHSTFNSRTMHIDGGYNYETPIIYAAEDGYVRKILASEKDIETLKATLDSERSTEWIYHQIEALNENESYISIPGSKKVFVKKQ